MYLLGLEDYLIGVFILVGIIFWAKIYQAKKIKKNLLYAYYFRGLMLKILGAIVFLLVYVYYYKGGDTINYFKSAKAVTNLLFQNFEVGLDILLGDLSKENHSYFDKDTGIPSYYMWIKPRTFTTARLTVIFVILGFKSLLSTTILLAAFSYYGSWKLFLVFANHYRKYAKQISIAFLFVPSFIFWGSGIMKDTYVILATAIIVYEFYNFFYLKKQKVFSIILFFLSVYVIITIKPYILFCLFPALAVWYFKIRMSKIKKRLYRLLYFPVVLGFFSLLFYFSYIRISPFLGAYGGGASALILKAKIIQEDLLREEQYGKNNYNIGRIEGVQSVLRMLPLAIFTALYRPLITEGSGIPILISSIENLIALVLTIYILLIYRFNLFRLYRYIKSQPILLFSLVFVLILATGLGVASANFGALVRYRTPLVPFFYALLMLLLLEKFKKEPK